MDRLKFALVIAALVATSHASPGQVPFSGAPGQPSASPTQPSYVVIGDVRNFHCFPLVGRTTVQGAVLNAGIVADSVSVSVLRASQDRAVWTQVISPTSADSGELAMNGDVLVVQSLQPAAESVQKNAALRTETGVIVVALADDTIAVGDVLQQTNSLPSPGQRLTISSRFQGRPAVSSLGLSDRVAHGDVLTVSRGLRTVLKGFGNLAPAWSEWQDSAPGMLPPAPLPDTTQLQISAPEMLPGEPSLSYFMPSQAPISVPTQEIVEDDTSPGSAEANPFAEVEAIELDAPLAVQSVSQANVLSDAGGPESAPQPPAEQGSLADVADPAQLAVPGMGQWNLIFIAGLLIAGSLILAGSLRADGETEADEHRATERQQTGFRSSEESKSTGIEPVIAHATISSVTGLAAAANQWRVPSLSGNIDAVESSAIDAVDTANPAAEVTIQVAPQTHATMGLVAPNEWFSRHLLNQQPASEAAPAAISENAIISENAVNGDVATNWEPATVLVTQRTSVETAQAEAVLTRTDFESPLELLNRMKEQVAEYLSDNDSVIHAPATSQFQATEFTELEDLLQNRLPIDLCQARLPLRISLFGRPAGPRRLRIDAAHTTLPAPHMNRSGEKKPVEPVAASASQSVAAHHGTEAVDSLNRALHYLQERTDS